MFPALIVPAMVIVLLPEHGVSQGEYTPTDGVDMVAAGASVVMGSLIVHGAKVRSILVSFVQLPAGKLVGCVPSVER